MLLSSYMSSVTLIIFSNSMVIVFISSNLFVYIFFCIFQTFRAENLMFFSFSAEIGTMLKLNEAW